MDPPGGMAGMTRVMARFRDGINLPVVLSQSGRGGEDQSGAHRLWAGRADFKEPYDVILIACLSSLCTSSQLYVWF